MTRLPIFSEEKLEEILQNNLQQTKSGEKKRRAKAIINYAKEGILDDLHTLQDMAVLAERLYKRARGTANMGTVIHHYLGYVKTFLTTDLPGGKENEMLQEIVRKIDNYKMAFKGGKTHREDGKLSEKEKKTLDEAQIDVEDFARFFQVVNQLLDEALEKVDNVLTPDEKEKIQATIVICNLALEPNVRLYPYALLKYDGHSRYDNLIFIESLDTGKVALVFNIVKSQGVPIFRSVRNEKLAMLMRKYYTRFRKDRQDHGYFFETKTGRPFQPDYLSKVVNRLLNDLFGANVNSRLVRIIETITSFDEDKKFSYRELEAMNYARNHSIEQGMLYDRTERMEVD